MNQWKQWPEESESESESKFVGEFKSIEGNSRQICPATQYVGRSVSVAVGSGPGKRTKGTGFFWGQAAKFNWATAGINSAPRGAR
jgi:hypothetical protein